MLGHLISLYARAPLHRGKYRILRAMFSILPSIPVRGAYGQILYSSPDATTVRSILGTYKPVFQCVDRLREGMAFIDVGANVGVFSLFASERVGETGRVIAFEPSQATFQRLVRNIAINGSNIHAFNTAVGRETRTARFDPSPGHTGKAHLTDHGSAEILQLGTLELSAILDVLVGWRECIVKIDVEGAEVGVIRGLTPFLRSAQVEALVVEVDACHLARFGETEAGLFRAIEGLGFRPEGRGSGHYDQVFVRSEKAKKLGAAA